MEKYTIGEFAKICQLTPQTLRYYDKIELLKPALVSNETNYRFYTQNQIFDIMLIKSLKHMGFSNGEVIKRLKSKNPLHINKFYERKIASLQNELEELYYFEQNIHISIDVLSMIQEIERQHHESPGPITKPTIKNIPERHMLSLIKERICNPQERLLHFVEIQSIIEKHKLRVISPFLITYYDKYPPQINEKNQIGLAIEIHPQDRHKIPDLKLLQKMNYLTQVFLGETAEPDKNFQNLKLWAAQKNIKLDFPVSHSYLVPSSTAKCSEKVVFEVQIPIKSP